MVDVVQWAETYRGAGVAGLPSFYDKPSIICQTEKK
jgi:hypothetical protein